jgi:hypothetical protein
MDNKKEKKSAFYVLVNVALIILYLVFIPSCRYSGQDVDLVEVPKDTIEHWILTKTFPKNPEMKIYNEKGKKISIEDYTKIPNPQDYKRTYYRDKNNKIVKMVLSTAKESDKIWFDSITKLEIKMLPVNNYEIIDLVEVDCKNKENLLEEVYQKDQNNRTRGIEFLDPRIDKANVSVVYSLYLKCKKELFSDLSEKGIVSIWLVIQHADANLRKEFFPIFIGLHSQNKLSFQYIAMMEDRMLRDQNKPQKYGTQYTDNQLYQVDHPDSVAFRRKKYRLE